MHIQRVQTGTVWEESVGFARVVRVGDTFFTAGTVAADVHGAIQGVDAYEQCCYIFEKLGRSMAEAGARMEHVVKTVCYITDLAHAEGFTRAHQQYLGHVRPVCTCVVIADLFGGALAEIELMGVITD
jgi:enamine deaminase RidA (YjgF/YER057c/UK114 family)